MKTIECINIAFFFCHTAKSFVPMENENLHLAIFSFQTFFIHIPFATSMIKAGFI